MNIFLRFFLRLLPNEFVEELNAVSLDELDDRGLIIWVDDIESGAVAWSEDLDKMKN